MPTEGGWRPMSTLVFAALLFGCWWSGQILGGAQEVVPAWTPEQIENEWIRSDLLRLRSGHSGWTIQPHEDARGGCDGKITGRWGFHTALEANPWWQVDLGGVFPIDRVVLHNRCDACGDRNRSIEVLLSEDGSQWHKVYQHDGTLFYGGQVGPPLVVKLGGRQARWIRVQLPGSTFLHLDEVEVFPSGGEENIALYRPATQSSVSQWSVRHPLPGRNDKADLALLQLTLERGEKLAAKLAELGVDVRSYQEKFQAFRMQLAELQGQSSDPSFEQGERIHRHYVELRRTIRRLAFENPFLSFDRILFVKRAPGAFPHMCDQYYGWWSRPGGGLYLLEDLKSAGPGVRCLTAGWPEGSFLDPELSYDGTKILFSFCRFYPGIFQIADKVNKDNLPEDAFYHIYEMNLDGTGVRRLTWGKYDHFSPRYLPNGDIIFLSTRKGKAPAVGPWTYVQKRASETEPTGESDCRPDSYVRCGGDNWRPVPVFTLHRMDSEGRKIWPISAFESFEWTPALAPDGRIYYARWDYIDRINMPFMSLWSTNPDGTNAQIIYGNFTHRPHCIFEARPIPGSSKWIFTASAHHSILGGALVLLDRTRGTEFERPIERITPEVCFPEAEGWPDHYFVNPYPLSEDFYLVAWSDRPLPAHTFLVDERNPVNPTGIYLLDRFGNLELLHRDPLIGSFYPIPIVPRPKPRQLPDRALAEEPEPGYFYVQDVYRGSEELPRGSVKRIRIVAVPPKVQPHMNVPSIGITRQDPGKYVIGTVPVEEDGSAYFAVPAGVPVFFQLLDQEGFALRTMRTATYLQAGQIMGCVGCHESREQTPAPQKIAAAVTRGPSVPDPGPPGSWPLRYDQLVQPVLDRHCVSCHHPEAENPKAAHLDLRPGQSYHSLLKFADGDLERLAFEKEFSAPGDCPARQSKLVQFLRQDETHRALGLDAESWERLLTWMDTYAQLAGHFSPEQEGDLQSFRQWWLSVVVESRR